MAKTDRVQELRKYLELDQPGIEVAPYFNPIVPKRDGHPVMILDVFDTERLRENAAKDVYISDEGAAKIEPVDLVGDASSIAQLAKSKTDFQEVQFVVSSHNFEHLPNPIKFLVGCGEILRPGGVLSMVVPDCRCCFDHFRYPTRLSEWLQAFVEDRNQPNAETVFENSQVFANIIKDGESVTSVGIRHAGAEDFLPAENLTACFDNYLQNKEDLGPYQDAHVSTFFGPSLELILRDLYFLGVIDLELIEVSETIGHEFFVHLRKAPERNIDVSAFYERRAQLLRDVQAGIGHGGFRQSRFGIWSIARTLIGRERFGNLRDMNTRRIKKRRERQKSL